MKTKFKRITKTKYMILSWWYQVKNNPKVLMLLPTIYKRKPKQVCCPECEQPATKVAHHTGDGLWLHWQCTNDVCSNCGGMETEEIEWPVLFYKPLNGKQLRRLGFEID